MITRMFGVHETDYLRAYRPDVDGLRAVAVLAVLFFHAGVPGFGGGFVGVDVFFVISGFLISRNIYLDLRDERFSFADFYERRTRRLLPALFVTLLCVFIAGFVCLSPLHLEHLARSVAYASGFLSNFWFWSEAGYFDSSADFKPLLHTWSLAVEEQYYLVWPGLLVLALAWSRRTIAAVMVGLFLLSMLSGEWMLSRAPDAVFYLMPFRFFEFLIGSGTFWLSRVRTDRNWIREIVFCLGLGLVFFAVVAFDENWRFPGLNALFPTIGAALVILAAGPRFSGRLLTNPLSVYIGLISYSLYLVHWPILIYYKYWWYRALTGAEQIALTFVCIAAATAMYYFVETPFRIGKGRTWLPSRRAFVSACVGSFVLLVAMGSYTSKRVGFPDRVQTQTVSNRSMDEQFDCRNLGPEKRCFLGASKSGKGDILLLGDSHANSIRPIIDQVGKRTGAKVESWTLQGCVPVFGTLKIYGTGDTRRERICRELIERWEDYAMSNDFDLVVLASRWDWLYEPVVYGAAEIRRDWLVLPEGSETTVESSRAVFAAQLHRTAEKLTESGSRVVIFGQAPLLAKSPLPCLTPGYFATSGYSAKCEGVDFETKIGRLKYSDQTIANVGTRLGKNVLAVLLSEHFCDEAVQTCVVVKDGKLLYHDTNHINAYGNEFLLRRLEEELVEFVRERAD